MNMTAEKATSVALETISELTFVDFLDYFGSKIGSKEPKNRLKFNSEIVS